MSWLHIRDKLRGRDHPAYDHSIPIHHGGQHQSSTAPRERRPSIATATIFIPGAIMKHRLQNFLTRMSRMSRVALVRMGVLATLAVILILVFVFLNRSSPETPHPDPQADQPQRFDLDFDFTIDEDDVKSSASERALTTPGTSETDSDLPPVNSFAVVVPFVHFQAWKLLTNLEQTWLQHVPCINDGANQDYVATLWLYFDASFETENEEFLGPKLKQILQNAVNNLPKSVSKCFAGGILLVDAQLHSLNHIEGACVMFYDIFDRYMNATYAASLGPAANPVHPYQHFYLMEPDAQPIQSNWLTTIAGEFRGNLGGCPSWWMKGSSSICNSRYGRIAERKDYHLNGNAMYCVQSPEFAEFRERVRRFFPPGRTEQTPTVSGCATGREFEDGYDHCFFQFRMDPANFDYAKHVHHRFVYTNVIQNRCKEYYDARQVIHHDSRTKIVHSSAVFRNPWIAKVDSVLAQVFPALRRVLQNDLTNYNRFLLTLSTRVRLGELKLKHLPSLICHRDSCTKSTISEDDWKDHVQSICQSTAVKRRLSTRKLEKWPARFNRKTLYAWVADLHTGPAMCNADIFRQLNVAMHVEVDYGMCIHHGVCRDRLAVLPYDDEHHRGFALEPCPHAYRKKFHEHYAKDEEMNRVDVVLCSHPAANCELYMSLNKTLIVFATTRVEFGRFDEQIDWRQEWLTGHGGSSPKIKFSRSGYNMERGLARWTEWVYNLKTIALNPRHIIAANNRYDQKYMEYHTGVKVQLLPSDCSAVAPQLLQYTPIRREFLIGPSRDNLDGGPMCGEWKCDPNQHPILLQLGAELKQANVQYNTDLRFVRVRDKYPTIELQDVLDHPAVIVMPYQVSTMFALEFYRANVPMLVPSIRLQIEWHKKYRFLHERVYGHPPRLLRSETDVPDPNSDSEESLAYWLQFSDFFTMPHFVYFDTLAELAELLHTTDFHAVHLAMKKHNKQERSRILERWGGVFDRIRTQTPPGTSSTSHPESINESLRALYGKRVWTVDEKAKLPREQNGVMYDAGSSCLLDAEKMLAQNNRDALLQLERTT